ncbi:MAG: amidohydrolase [Clostridia bacterium]|nr:amidohydrolase [Clostridia bacterium]
MIYKKAEEISDKLIKIRRDLHQIPELEFEVFETAEYIEKQLDMLGIEHYRLAKTGIVGIIRGKSDDITLLIREDIDALPVTELNDIPYKSKNIGKMHACGHDAHTTCLIGMCMILKEMNLNGTVKVVFQPAEEGDGGALPMIKEGVMTNPDVTAAVSLHVEPLAKVGTLLLRDGAIAASPDEFTIIINGVGGHGACPEDCNNPIIPAAALVSQLKTIVKDNSIEETECVVSVCSINGGNSYNIIPDCVKITGTVRSLSEDIRTNIEKLINDKINDVVKRFNCTYNYQFTRSFPPLINDKKINDLVAGAAEKIEMFDKIEYLENSPMLGDDFAYFAQCVPSSYFKLGVGNDEINNPLHSPYFNIDESSLSLGAAILAQIAVDYLGNE